MPASRKPIHKYPTVNPEPEKYLPSFFLDISVETKIFRAEVRPLSKDKGYYTINLDGIFMGHIHKSGLVWTDFLGNTNELYQMIGESIEAYLSAHQEKSV
ncbi:MAG TPA: hypothetical protein VHQ04_05620 [Puia sp.]|nr:hypothetical protein [Puia sp.]